MLLRLTALAAFAFGFAAVGCAASDGEHGTTDEDLASTGHGSDEWFYSGAIPVLDNPEITTSLAGHTNHVTGLLPVGAAPLPDLPHVKTMQVNGRTQVDVVYPIATAANAGSNSKPGTYSFYESMPYRPNGGAYTPEAGEHFVTWGGFPFIAYNDGIAFHGPITDEVSGASTDVSVWYLRRGAVSSGCNRMMGEHVTEMANIIGINMHKLYKAAAQYTPTTTAKVHVIADYDTYQGKYIDIDYPTDTAAVRPASVKGADNVVMFGSWVATQTPTGTDLPPDMKWEGGVNGQLYVFKDHAVRGNVCSMPQSSLTALAAVAAKNGGQLPADFCTRKYACDDKKGSVCAPSEI